jgi:hypothetical protein
MVGHPSCFGTVSEDLRIVRAKGYSLVLVLMRNVSGLAEVSDQAKRHFRIAKIVPSKQITFLVTLDKLLCCDTQLRIHLHFHNF